jgi:hypothetical protein
MATIGDIVKTSLMKIGVLAMGEPLPDDEGSDARKILRQMIDAWTNENLIIPAQSVITKQLINDQNQYTIGIYPSFPIPDNHIETARPQEIIHQYLFDGAGTSYSLKVIDVREYDSISVKESQSIPSRMYIRKGWPLNTIILDSLPYAQEMLHLTVIQPLSELIPAVSLTEEVNLPPGYEEVLIDNLAIRMAPIWQQPINPAVATLAIEGKKMLKRSNSTPMKLRCDIGLRNYNSGYGTYNINQGF